ncbi:type II/IV secretion system protein [Candidatus Saccharibacteria bacterium]|jgi:type IV pilus assembly protein PilB|nr:type II/IV secretion system protein [Candidatus Saccharibacteria bacterium]
MRISDRIVEQILTSGGKITTEQLEAYKMQGKNEKKPLQDIVLNGNAISERDLTKAYSEIIDIPYIDIDIKGIDKEILQLVPERIARQYNVVVIGVDDKGQKLLAMDDPDDIQAISFLQKELGNDVRIFMATHTNILQAIDQYRENISSEITEVISAEQEEEQKGEKFDQEDLAEDSPVAQTVNLLVEGAIKTGASDIHIEPREGYVSVRYRIDGILREVNKLPKNVQGALVSRIKILSNLKIDERRAPQDGRFKIAINGLKYALRVSTLPITDGEKVVMRILNESSKALLLEELGYWGTALDTINQAITQPHGMILVTGPTGSGKSTSLFSVLSLLNNPTVNISTIEDPVEYKIPGANQTQVNVQAGMTFAAGLRALLRQDPNIIMVGEIRDSETSGLAVQAALTGHLVFATLHTNNAATCLPRLLDMGIEPFLIASTVRAVVGQRLVRRLCRNCRVPVAPESDLVKKINKTFKIKASDDMKKINQLEKLAIEGGIGTDPENKNNEVNQPSSSGTAINRIYKAKDGGCEECGHNGYKGRMGIYEVLGNSSELEKLIISNSTSDAIENQAIKEGMITMQLDGFIKALRGQTTIEEILRVTATEE